MIDNSDIVGHWQVRIICRKNVVSSFQCPTLDDATNESNKIAKTRLGIGLETSRAYAQQIIGPSMRGLELGHEEEILLSK